MRRTLALIGAIALLAACTTAPPANAEPVLNVLGAENFYADLLAQIGGTHVKATSLLNDPNTDPHEYEASPAAAKAVADARLVIVNGMGYDAFMRKLLDASPRPGRITIDVQTTLGRPDDENAHVWYDPATMPKVAAEVTAALARLDPQSAAYFQANERAYLASLKAVDDRIAALKTRYDGTPVAFTEPVAAYLAAAIGLRVLTPEGFQRAIEQGVDPAPADLAAERDLITGGKVKALLFNSQVTTPVTKSIRELAVANGIPVVGVAETMPPSYASYQEWMLGQLGDLERALGRAG